MTRPRLATLLALIALAGCAAPRVPLAVSPEAARWQPLIAGAAPPVPPPAGDEAGAYAGVKAWEARRTADDRRAVAYWQDGPGALRWLAHARELIAAEDLPDHARATRALALVAAAMHDATIYAWRAKAEFGRAAPGARHPDLHPWLVEPGLPTYPSAGAAQAAAAAGVLASLFPVAAAGLVTKVRAVAQTRVAAGLEDDIDAQAGTALGEAVAALAIARAGHDDLTETPPASRPGLWNSDVALSPAAGTWAPWLVGSVAPFQPPPPPAPGTPAFRAEVAAARAGNDGLDIRRRALAAKWNKQDMAVLWSERAGQVVARAGWRTPQAEHALAVVHGAMADAAIACWQAQYATLRPRPVQADPKISAVVPTPGHPAHPSETAATAMAAATVLGALFPDEAPALEADAKEAGEAGFFAGLHYRLDVTDGAQVGQAVGLKAVERYRAD